VPSWEDSIIAKIRNARSVELTILGLTIVETYVETILEAVKDINFTKEAVVRSEALAAICMLVTHIVIYQWVDELIRRVELNDLTKVAI